MLPLTKTQGGADACPGLQDAAPLGLKLAPFLAGLILGGLLLGVGGSVAHAGQIFSESFEFGPEVAGRAHLEAGDVFELGAVQEGEGEWKVSPKRQRQGLSHKMLEYVQGGGVRFVDPENSKSTSLFALLPAGIAAQTWEATVEFIPGTLWGKEDLQPRLREPGASGLWLGLVEDGAPVKLLGNIEDSEFVAVQAQFSDSAGNDGVALLRLRGTSGSVQFPTGGKTLQIDPEALHRLVLRVDLAAQMAEVVLEDEQGIVLAELRREAPGVAGFNAFQIDLTALPFNESGIPPVLKKVVLKTE